MDNTTLDNLKEQLMKDDPVFRQLATEHKKYESSLDELSALTFPTEEEQLEETLLKKKKLALKDQMYELLLQREASVH